MNFNFGAMDYTVLDKSDISYLDEMLLDSEGKIKVLSYIELKDVPQQHLSLFCVKNGIYSVPTKELISFLEEEIGDRKEKTIEIGSGNGIYSRELGIKGTDNFMQLMPAVKAHYEMLGQSIVPYDRENVERLEAMEAIRKYRPEIVVGAWCTHKYSVKEHWRGGNEFGVHEKKLLEKTKKYIHIGNDKVHDKKPILKEKHRKISEPWILSRSLHKEHNIIYIWGE